MSRLTPSLLVLDKGLDLQTAKILAPEGSVFNSLNYEQVDFQGQKRIDGYARYDGTVLPAFNDYYKIAFSPTGGWTGFPEDSNTNLFVDNKLWAVAIKNANVDGDEAYIQILDHSMDVVVGDNLQVDGSSIGTITSLEEGKTTDLTVEEHYLNLLELSSVVKSRVTTLPEPIAGLHWFQDRLYAVAGIVTAQVTTGTTWINREVTFSSGDVGTVVNQTSGSMQILTTYNLGNSESITNPVLGNVTLGNRSDSNSATFYESRTEQQTLTEDGPSGPYRYGWIAKHLGWEVNFDRGIALYGELASVNQNRQNVGIEGPTSTAGTNGSPAVLSQNAFITNRPVQVNGWKSYDSPTAYVLDAKDVQLDDSAYIYADAYIQWTAASSTVVTPGSDMNGLVERSPTSSVEYEAL